MPILKLEPNKPYTISVRYPTGKQVTNNFGGEQLRWILANGDLLYTPLIVGTQIEDLGIKPGERFILTKQKNGEGVKWIVSTILKNAEAPATTVRAGTPGQHEANKTAVAALLDRTESLDGIPDSVPPTRLEDALKTAVAAAASAEKYAESISYSCRFSSADVKSMAISVLIGMQQGRHAA